MFTNLLERRLGLVATLLPLLFLVLAALLLTVPSTARTAVSASVGLVPDVTGINDQGYNQLAYEGLLRAQSDLGVTGTVYTPTSDAEYETQLQACADAGNDLCISVGFTMEAATQDVASANPGTLFAIVDAEPPMPPNNLRSLRFAVDEAGYLAGTLAGLMTESDIVGGVGGLPIPSVDAFLVPYSIGAKCANLRATSLLTYTEDFGNPAVGAEFAQRLLDQGADVIFAVAGGAGSGALLTTTQSGAWAIGVDVDQYYSVFQGGAVDGAEYLLTSAVKHIDNAVYQTISDVVSGTFTSGTVRYDLADEGVGLAPYHEADASVPQSVRDVLDAVRQGIINGSIDVYQPCAAVGLVPDVTGINDQGYNQLAYEGLLRAQSDLGVTGTVYTPTSDAEYETQLQACADAGNDLCISVGFFMEAATQNVASANPGTLFAIVDAEPPVPPDNLRSLRFAVDEAGYLAGTLAGLMTESDIVGGVGGLPIPSVDAFLVPYSIGAECANLRATSLLTYTEDFANPAVGAEFAQRLLDQGADVIFAVAGGAGSGALLTTTQSGAWAIGVDVDQYYSVFQGGAVDGAQYLLTSAVKHIDNAVYQTISDVVSDTFTSGIMLYDLADDGVGLAPHHEADASVPQSVRDVLDAVRQGILDGTIDITEPCESHRVYLPLIISRFSP